MQYWNIESIREHVKIYGDGDSLISTCFKNSNDKLKFKCRRCNTEFEMCWNSYRKGHRHQACKSVDGADKRKLSYEYVNSYFAKKGYALLSDVYENSHAPLVSVCPEGHTYIVRFGDFSRGSRCNECFHIKNGYNSRLTFEYVKNFVVENGNGDTLLSDAYTRNSELLIFKCHLCNREYTMRFGGFKEGYRCKYCSRKRGRKTQLENIISESYNFAVKYPEILEEWDWIKNTVNPFEVTHGSTQSVFWICKKCDNSYQSSILSRTGVNKTGCPFCNLSKGENRIIEFLKFNKIKYLPQYIIPECRKKKPLPFDCGLWIENKLILIEYQGVFHYESRLGYISDEEVKQRQEHDKIKKQYCKNHDIQLIEIPYWDFDNIESILNKELNLLRKEVEFE